MANLLAIILPTVLGSLLVILCCLYILTAERRQRRKTLLARDKWTVGKDLQRGATLTEHYVNGQLRNTEVAGNIVIDGEWFPLGEPEEKAWCCCGAVWADDLAQRGLNWKGLEAREPDRTQTKCEYSSTKSTSTSSFLGRAAAFHAGGC